MTLDAEACANCASPLRGPYCHRCGQKGRPLLSVGVLLREVFENLTRLDNRLLRTLPLLLFRPGRLSRHWSQGRHAPFVPPLALFLFAVLPLFLAPELTGRDLVSVHHSENSGWLFDFGASRDEGAARSRLMMSLRLDATVAGIEAKAAGRPPPPPSAPLTEPQIQQQLERGLAHTARLHGLVSRFVLLLVPITMAILWLLLLKRGATLYEHGVVALNETAFLALLLTLCLVAARFVGEWASLLLLGVPVHAVSHLRGAYGLRWLGAVLRGALLLLLSLVVLFTFLSALVELGISGQAAVS